jgi:branched-subunit amino acid transport protein AzlD
MTTTQEVFLIGTVVLGTLITRFAPFLIFSSEKSTPSYIIYLGKVLPYATTAMLVVYCLKDSSLLAYPYKIPEALGILLIIVLHKWKSNMFISMVGSTLFYMMLTQFVFIK